MAKRTGKGTLPPPGKWRWTDEFFDTQEAIENRILDCVTADVDYDAGDGFWLVCDSAGKLYDVEIEVRLKAREG